MALSTALVRAISEAVYRERLGDSDTARMIAKDKDSGEMLRRRSESYDTLTRAYLAVLARDYGFSPEPGKPAGEPAGEISGSEATMTTDGPENRTLPR